RVLSASAVNHHLLYTQVKIAIGLGELNN
ncbi:MAG: hypothetical protein QOC99_3039, partial [Acidobacteriota bacterium]|nr:hypothetical protein [Acidobacteriota bacterium]